jgi:hypothetical protein
MMKRFAKTAIGIPLSLADSSFSDTRSGSDRKGPRSPGSVDVRASCSTARAEVGTRPCRECTTGQGVLSVNIIEDKLRFCFNIS